MSLAHSNTAASKASSQFLLVPWYYCLHFVQISNEHVLHVPFLAFLFGISISSQLFLWRSGHQNISGFVSTSLLFKNFSYFSYCDEETIYFMCCLSNFISQCGHWIFCTLDSLISLLTKFLKHCLHISWYSPSIY